MTEKKGIGWPIGIFGVYGVFVAGLIVAVVLSVNNNVDMVTNNYYEKTLIYEQQITRIKNTQAFAHEPEMAFSRDKAFLILSMPMLIENDQYKGTIQFFRPSDSKLDKKFGLSCDAHGKQYIPLAEMSHGKWKLQLLWSDGQKEYYYEKVFIL
jgi:nitrogen fixation protein FixH